MKVIFDDIPIEGREESGRVQFIFENFFYDIGTLDDVLWISRMTVEDYENGRNNWERIERWVPEDRKDFHFLKGLNFPE